jgi:hypothetical protein
VAGTFCLTIVDLLCLIHFLCFSFFFDSSRAQAVEGFKQGNSMMEGNTLVLKGNKADMSFRFVESTRASLHNWCWN